jgi:hypothetical protein
VKQEVITASGPVIKLVAWVVPVIEMMKAEGTVPLEMLEMTVEMAEEVEMMVEAKGKPPRMAETVVLAMDLEAAATDARLNHTVTVSVALERSGEDATTQQWDRLRAEATTMIRPTDRRRTPRRSASKTTSRIRTTKRFLCRHSIDFKPTTRLCQPY